MPNRSPSPISPNPNSTTRTSFDGNEPFALTNPRKLDPITPANAPTPSDFARRRRSVGQEGSGSCLKNCDGKENDVVKDQMLKASKLQSPAKGSKSFMAPTISAASKFTPSPRKKTLVERNEPVRTSISLSDGKAMFFSNLSEDLEPKSVLQVSKPSKKVTFLDVPQDSQNTNDSLPESVISDPDGSKIELSLKNSISCSPVSSSIAPIDADPSMPPYDPKTNYLSPRPQFLFYKPNPRIEVLLNKDKETGPDEFKPLEYDDDDDDDDDMSDHFSSDSEGTQDSEKEKSEAIASADMVTGFEVDDLRLYDELYEKEKLADVMLADMFDGREFSEKYINVSGESEEKLETVASGDDMVVMGLEEISKEENLNFDRKIEKKSLGISRLMCFSMVLMMLLMAACVSVSVTRYPSLEEFGLIKELSFSDLGQFYHQSRVVATTNAKVIWETCVSFVSKVADELKEGVITPVPLKYVNLSDLQKDWNDGVEDDNDDDDELDSERSNFEEEEYAAGVYDSDEGFENEIEEQGDEVLEIDEIVLVDSSKLDAEYREDTQNLEKIAPSSIISAPQDGVDEQEDEVLEINEIVLTGSSELDSQYREDTQNPEIEKIIPVDSSELNVEYQEDTGSPKEIAPSSIITVPQDQESEIVSENEVVPPENGDVNCGSDAALLEQGILLDTETLPGKSVQNSIMTSEVKFLVHYAVGFSSFLAALSAAVAVFMYQYKRIPSFRVNKMDHELDNNKQKKQQEVEKAAFSSQNWQTEVDDDASCPSATSSFLKIASRTTATINNNCKKETMMMMMMMMRGESEVHTSETKMGKYYSKRESLASSSEFTMGSSSYGSFTTFEKIPIKNANGEEEIITPVRRSNRIRSHRFTSS